MSDPILRTVTIEERAQAKPAVELSLKDTIHKIAKPFVIGFTVVFALIGLALIAAFIAVNLHLTDTSGIVDRQADEFWKENGGTGGPILTSNTFFTQKNYCNLKRLKKDYPGTFLRIFNLALNEKDELAQHNLNVAIENLDRNECATETGMTSKREFELLADVVDNENLFIFAGTEEWEFFKDSVVKDVEVIKKVERQTGIKSRVLVAQLVAEQMRLFHSDRPFFKKAISPLKVLASMSQFSWGVLGIKEETAKSIEKNLKDTTSPYYLGTEYEHLLDFKTPNTDDERFKRITHYRDHYYAYLYAALFNKQVIAQWYREGVDISNRPEILATLYNIGFRNSKPNPDPQTGGAELTINGKRYSFGRVAYSFYYSGELLDEFPQ